MSKAFVLLNTKPGSETKVAEKLIKRVEVKDLSIVYGEFDIVMIIETNTMDSLRNFILDVRKDKDVERTSTLIST